MASIQPTDMQQAIGEILQTFNHSVDTIVDEAAVKTGKQGAAWLKSGSPIRTGKYAKGWTYRKTKRGTVYIYNAKRYQLTHLLEKGHATVKTHGRYGSTSQTKAIPHISIVEHAVALQFEDRIKNAIEYQK